MASTIASFPSTSFNSNPSNIENSIKYSHKFPASYVTFRRNLPSISAVCSITEVVSTSIQTSTFYEVLGIQAGATSKEIKAAYRKLARVLHPDAAVASNEKRDTTSSAEEFIRVHEAYTTLSDPKKRADYDRKMWVNGRRLRYSPTYCTMGTTKCTTSSSSGFSGYTRRTWETDQCW
ncbi:chaperone protein dnaJ 11, chloroplastic-like [Amaranthus tricolor]|uniref:chaperone protein dnaJ 11, chloroplastic-like n=1 Tax=Amaranthus tricolor TaxID=29722 RepID=UPI0025885A5C|nr:chaperone protein dnaJ 11, chloroplastic-like [Amaranthus tricolor]